MYDAMRATSFVACLYFVIVMILGNIIMLQLLVAIVLSNFDQSHKNIEERIEFGSTVQEAIQSILGHLWTIDFDENEGSTVNIKIGISKVFISGKTELPDLSPIPGVTRNRSEVYKTSSSLKIIMKRTQTITDKVKSNKVFAKPYPIDILRPKSEVMKQDSEESVCGTMTRLKNDKNIPPEMADDMSIHLDFDLISDKLDILPQSKFTERITKATTKNFKEVILEDPQESEEEEEKIPATAANLNFSNNLKMMESVSRSSSSKSKNDREAQSNTLYNDAF